MIIGEAEPIELRDYQDHGAEAPFRYFESGGEGNPLLAYPTGTGKSVIIAETIIRLFRKYGRKRCIVLTHSETLVGQNYAKLKEMWPDAMAGLCASGLKRFDKHYPITFAMIQTIWNMAPSYGKIDIVFIDEAHMVPANEDAQYVKFLSELKKFNPYLVVIGYTATPYRIGQGKLTDEGGIFTDMIVDATNFNAFNWFLDQGYLTKLIPRNTDTQYEVEGLRKQAGEFNLTDMQKEFDRAEKTERALTEMLDLAVGRHHGMIFATGVQHTINVTAMLLAKFGEKACCVHSKMSREEVRETIKAFKAGKYRWMVNNGILTTGFDFPALDCIVFLRATNSVGLWVQMLGRGTRVLYGHGLDLGTAEGRLEAILAGGKPNCLVLDFARNTMRLGPINDPQIPKARGKGPKGECPMKECGACGVLNHPSARECIACMTPFPIKDKLVMEAGTEVLIKENSIFEPPVIKTWTVDQVTYLTPPGILDRPPSIQVIYYCGRRRFKKWINLEGVGRHQGRQWWKENTGEEPPEETIHAIEMLDSLRVPSKIDVWMDHKPPQVQKIYYGEDQYFKLSASEAAEDSEVAG